MSAHVPATSGRGSWASGPVLARRAVLGGGLALLGAGLAACSHGSSSTVGGGPTASSTSAPVPSSATAAPGATAASSSTASAADRLPFAVDGLGTAGTVTTVSGSVPAADARSLWTFGGDYSRIGSLPLDATTVFGSESDHPDSLMSYSAALLTKDSFTRLTPKVPATADPTTYREPQDGTATAHRIVWRAASVGTDENSSAIDDWEVWGYDRSAGGEAVRLASASALNGTDQTPAGPEVLPTSNDDAVYFASNVKDSAASEGWTRHVLQLGTSSGSDPVDLAAGDYPAAVDGGVLYAAPDHDGALTTLVERTGASSVRTLVTLSGSWTISGVWANGVHRALAVGTSQGGDGSYLALWADGEEDDAVWLHVPSSRVIGSASAARFAWGGGSDGEATDMFVVDWDGGGVARLGSATGYARPALSPDGAVVLVPATDGNSPVTWTVVSL